jgi:Tol biopolymer transport system component
LAFTEGAIFDILQIYVIGVKGTNKRQLTDFSYGQIYSLAWTHDSRGLLFSYPYRRSATNESADLEIVPMGGGEPRRLTLNVGHRLTQFSISSDGRRLLATAEQGQRELWKVPLGPDPKANGDAATRLLDSSADPLFAHLAPDAELVLINSGSTGSRNLFTVKLDGSGSMRQIKSVPDSAVTHAALSRDGTKVAYSSVDGGNSQIWVINVDGSNPRQVTSGAGQHLWPIWSRDGQWIIFQAPREGLNKLWRIPASGGEPVLVTKAFGSRADWSPVDDRIAYYAGSELEVADAMTGQVSLKVPGPGWTFAMPVWSQDGKRFSAVRRSGDFADSLWIIDAQTGMATLAATFSGPFHMIFRAGWSRDSKSLIVNRQENIRHLVLLEDFAN